MIISSGGLFRSWLSEWGFDESSHYVNTELWPKVKDYLDVERKQGKRVEIDEGQLHDFALLRAIGLSNPLATERGYSLPIRRETLARDIKSGLCAVDYNFNRVYCDPSSACAYIGYRKGPEAARHFMEEEKKQGMDTSGWTITRKKRKKSESFLVKCSRRRNPPFIS